MSSVCLAAALSLLGHNPDTSYARISIAPDKVETRLTYDVFTLLKIVALDDNGDGQLQRSELAGHADQIAAYLRQHIGLAVSEDDDDADLGQFAGFLWPPDVGEAIAGSDFHSANGLIHFNFLRRLDEPPEEVAIAFGFFEKFTDRHTVLAVFLCNGEEYETTFTSREADFTYVTGFPPAQPRPDDASPPPEQTRHTLAERLWRFFKMGVEHIFLGYDHICFLIALIVVSRLSEIVKIVTSFTIAHSITLILATLEVVSIDTRIVETCIAATIVYVAVENLWLLRGTGNRGQGTGNGGQGTGDRGQGTGDRGQGTENSGLQSQNVRIVRPPTSDLRPPTPGLQISTAHRWWLTFFFGLIHGFGFANVLREMGLPTVGLVRCLLSFNVGVEAGQLVIAVCLLPLAWVLQHWKYGRWATLAISLVLALFGAAWFVDRAFNLELMQRIGL